MLRGSDLNPVGCEEALETDQFLAVISRLIANELPLCIVQEFIYTCGSFCMCVGERITGQ